MSEKLKPCPFCGREAELALERHCFGGAEVECLYCYANAGHFEDDPQGVKAVMAWNTRALPPKITGGE